MSEILRASEQGVKIGIIKDIDKLGRLVIPKKYRELYGVEEKAEIRGGLPPLLGENYGYTKIMESFY